MKIAIVGPGALGCLLSAFLAEAGEDVLLLDHRPERAERISERGLVVEGVSGERRVRVPVSLSVRDVADAELILLCVKAYHTESAIRPLTPHLNRDARILTLQNGVGNVESLAEICGRERIWGGVTAQGATVLAWGHIRHAGTGLTQLGALSGIGQDARLGEVAETLNRAGLETRIEPAVQSLLWSKLIVNAGINPLTAITRLRNGQLLDYDGTVRIMEQAVAEAVTVAEAQGIQLCFPDAQARTKEVARCTANNIASMLQDVLNERQTEIEYINGAVAAIGRRLGLSTPVNETLTELVQTIQSSYGTGL